MKNFTFSTGKTIKLPEFKDIKDYVYSHDTSDEDFDEQFADDFDLYIDGLNDDDYEALAEERDIIWDTFYDLCFNKSVETLADALGPDDEDYEKILANRRPVGEEE